MAEASYSRLSWQPFLDSALPIGGFSHSFGLETYVQQNRIVTFAQLEEYCRVLLRHNWASADCLLIKEIFTFAGINPDPMADWREIWACDQRLHVQRAARETREGMQKMGRRLYQLGREVYPELPWQQLTKGIDAGECPGSYPLLHGWLGLNLGISLDEVAEGYLYNSLLNAINSALRLMAIGQTQGQKILVKLIPECTSAWQQVCHLPFADAYTMCPDSEIAMMQHEGLYSRLFMS